MASGREPPAELRAAVELAQEEPELRCGRYLLVEELGRGTFGVVHQAWDPEAGRVVAVKVLSQLSAIARQRFTREVKAGARLDHPHIVSVLDSGEDRRRPFLVMDLVAGPRIKELGGELEPRRAARILADAARAIDFAHAQGVLHRDLKPENVMVADGDQARVLDFGLVRFTLPEGPKLTATGEMIGSPLYMAPEQSGGVYDERSDVFALGATLYFALCGQAPLEAPTLDAYLDLLEREHPAPPSARAAGVPAELDTVCLKCLEKDPARRYASAGEVADDLERWLRGEPILAQPPGGVERGLRWAHRKRVGLVLGALAIAAVVVTVALLARS